MAEGGWPYKQRRKKSRYLLAFSSVDSLCIPRCIIPLCTHTRGPIICLQRSDGRAEESKSAAILIGSTKGRACVGGAGGGGARRLKMRCAVGLYTGIVVWRCRDIGAIRRVFLKLEEDRGCGHFVYKGGKIYGGVVCDFLFRGIVPQRLMYAFLWWLKGNGVGFYDGSTLMIRVVVGWVKGELLRLCWHLKLYYYWRIAFNFFWKLIWWCKPGLKRISQKTANLMIFTANVYEFKGRVRKFKII